MARAADLYPMDRSLIFASNLYANTKDNRCRSGQTRGLFVRLPTLCEIALVNSIGYFYQ